MTTGHKTTKDRYLAYREAAHRLYNEMHLLGYRTVSLDETVQPDHVQRQISIEKNATVQMVEGGAFVEAIVWVPESALTTPTGPRPPGRT